MSYDINCHIHGWTLAVMPVCPKCAREKPKPYRDPCIWGGAMVGSDPAPRPRCGYSLVRNGAGPAVKCELHHEHAGSCVFPSEPLPAPVAGDDLAARLVKNHHLSSQDFDMEVELRAALKKEGAVDLSEVEWPNQYMGHINDAQHAHNMAVERCKEAVRRASTARSHTMLL